MSTPLHNATLNDHTETIKLLIELGADVNDKGALGYTPLHYAAWIHTETIKLLIELGADVNGKDKCGNTPLHYAKMSGNIEAIKLLDDYILLRKALTT